MTVDDLVAFMSGVTLTDDQRTMAAPVVLDGVQAALEVWLNRPIQPVLVREIIRSDADYRLWTTVAPIHYVVGLLEVTETSGAALIPSAAPALTTLTLADYQAFDNSTVPDDGNEVITTIRRMDTMPHASYILATYPDQDYQVDYVGGYNGFADPALKLAILRVAAREMTENHDDTLSIKEDFAKDVPAQPMLKGWQPHELTPLRRLKRRVLV